MTSEFMFKKHQKIHETALLELSNFCPTFVQPVHTHYTFSDAGSRDPQNDKSNLWLNGDSKFERQK